MSGWKSVVEQHKKLSIFELKKYGALRPVVMGLCTMSWGEARNNSIGFTPVIRNDENYVELNYRAQTPDQDEWQVERYRIYLEKTACHFGGHRYWFNCPRCNERVANLYLVGTRFTCRKCNNLAYHSQNQTRGKYFFFGRCADLDERAYKLYDGKRWQTHYNGKMTMRYRKHLMLKIKSNRYAGIFLEEHSK